MKWTDRQLVWFQTNVTLKRGKYLSGLDRARLGVLVNSLNKCGKCEGTASLCLDVCRIVDTISYTLFCQYKEWSSSRVRCVSTRCFRMSITCERVVRRLFIVKEKLSKTPVTFDMFFRAMLQPPI